MGAKVVETCARHEARGEIILTLPLVQEEMVEDNKYTDNLSKMKMTASEVSVQMITWRVVASILLPCGEDIDKVHACKQKDAQNRRRAVVKQETQANLMAIRDAKTSQVYLHFWCRA